MIYPPGSFVRIMEICRDTKTGRPGILPIARSTWNKWVTEGTAPQPLRLNGTPVWTIEAVRGMAQPEP